MIDSGYAQRRAVLLADIRLMSGKNYSKEFPVLEAEESTDDYLYQCEIQLEKLENLASSIAGSMAR